MSEPVEPSRPCDIVLGAAERTPRRVALLAAVAALLLHVGGAAAAVALNGHAEPPPVRAKSAPLVVIDHVIDLEPAKPPEPEPVAPTPMPPVERKAPPPRIKQQAEPAPRVAPEPELEQATPNAPEPEQPPSEPPAAAQAAQVVAAANLPAAMFAVATGSGPSYAGGTTSASGTSTSANHTGQVGVGSGLSKARPPQLHSRSWPCGWPHEAEDLDEEEVVVTVRASIAADGSVQDVEVLSDPGHGFGKRASLCARTKVSFDAARDASGKPVAGETPPLTIHFLRDPE